MLFFLAERLRFIRAKVIEVHYLDARLLGFSFFSARNDLWGGRQATIAPSGVSFAVDQYLSALLTSLRVNAFNHEPPAARFRDDARDRGPST